MKSLEDLRSEGVLDALATVYDSHSSTEEVLHEIGFPLSKIPHAPTSRDRWWEIGKELDRGRVVRGFERLLGLAANDFPGNDAFRPWGSNAAATADRDRHDPAAPLRRRNLRKLQEQKPHGLLFHGRRFFPSRLQNSSLTLPEYMDDWLDDDGAAAVTLLSGPIGIGKSIATIQAIEHLQAASADRPRPHLDLWIPFSRTLRLAEDPHEAIHKHLGLDDFMSLWDPELQLRCIVLDGLDEGWTINSDRVLHWLAALFDGAGMARPGGFPRFLISGRDVILDETSLPPPLGDLLESFTRSRSMTGSQSFRRVQMKSWDADDSIWLLREELAERVGEQQAAQLITRIAPDVLSSPLLYGLALETLLQESLQPMNSEDPGDATVADTWALIDLWIERILHSNVTRHFGQLNANRRREAARLVSLLLVLSGRGMSGATLEELQQAPLIRDWLTTLPDNEPLDVILWQLQVGCLLACHEGRFAPFHESILIHLAAEGLLLLAGRPDDSSTPPTLPPSELSTGGKGGTPVGIELLDELPSSRVFGTLPLLFDRCRGGELTPSEATLQSGAPFGETLRYLARHKLSRAPLPSIELEGRWPELEADPFERLKTGIEVISRGALVQALTDHLDLGDLALAEGERHTTPRSMQRELWGGDGSAIERLHLAFLPAGTYPIWRVDRGGRRELHRVVIEEQVGLGQRPVTVCQYARFLQSNSDVELPNQPKASWTRTASGVDFDPDAAELPVTGISRQEAEQYCRWLTRDLDQDGHRVLSFRLPEADWLRVAAWGPELRDPVVGIIGPLGHQDLVGECWQWTADGTRQNALVFGGSEALAGKTGSLDGLVGLKTLSRDWPDLTATRSVRSRDRYTGFRIATVIPEGSGPETDGKKEMDGKKTDVPRGAES